MYEQHLRQLANLRKDSSYSELLSRCKRYRDGREQCFELSIGGFNLNDEECALACQAAIKAAKFEADQYRKVSALVWPIQVYVYRGMISEAEKLTGFTYNEAKSVTPSNSRAYALEKLCNFVWKLDPKYRKSILKDLFTMIDAVPGWRIGRACAHIADDFDRAGDSAFVDQLLLRCKNDWLIDRVERDRAKRRL